MDLKTLIVIIYIIGCCVNGFYLGYFGKDNIVLAFFLAVLQYICLTVLFIVAKAYII